MRRPGEVTVISVYHVLFSLVLVGVLFWQGVTHHPSDGLWYAAPVIVMLLFVSLVPAVIAYGLWVMDEGARIACLIFTLLHGLTTVAYLQRGARILAAVDATRAGRCHHHRADAAAHPAGIRSRKQAPAGVEPSRLGVEILQLFTAL